MISINQNGVARALVKAFASGRIFAWYVKHQGVKTASGKVLKRLKGKRLGRNILLPPDLVKFLRASQKLLVINAGFKFDNQINQRCMALAKEAAAEGFSVLFIAWEWWPGELSVREMGLVRENVFQISPTQFSHVLDALERIEIPEKTLLLTVPTREMAIKITEARIRGFRVIYDIFDDWESFYQVGQAPWYEKKIEQHAVLNADKVTVVSSGLLKLFDGLRDNIFIVPNGYSPREHPGNQMRSLTSIGYFGHLSEGWFDWNLVFGLARRLPQISIEIIGDGHSQEMANEVRKYPSISLLGPKPYAELSSLTCSWSLGLIPFKESRLSECVDPLKVYEYLDLGLVSVSTGMPHLGQYPNSFHVEGLDQLVSVVEAHASGSLAKAPVEELSAFLLEARWSSRLGNILK